MNTDPCPDDKHRWGIVFLWFNGPTAYQCEACSAFLVSPEVMENLCWSHNDYAPC